MKGKQKTLQEWQVYHQMTYESQWKTVIDEEWGKYKAEKASVGVVRVYGGREGCDGEGLSE